MNEVRLKVFAPLYKKTKTGDIQIWKLEVLGNEIVIRYGKEGGKEIISTKECKGKNKGKANETSDFEQALLEAESLWRKQQEREQYKTTKEACDDVLVAPMLAQNINDNWKLVKSSFASYLPVAVSRKLDGNRLLVFVDENQNIKYYSRKLVPIPTITHLNTFILQFIKDNTLCLPVYLDGEAYIHGESLQTINSLLKRKQPQTEKINFNVYDCFFPDDSNLDFRARFLNQIKQNNEKVNIVHSFLAFTIEDINTYLSVFEDEKYEGAMIRLIDKPYQAGTRSKYLLKYKRFEDAEFQIVDFKYGKDSFKDCVIWVCKTETGEEFDILAAGTIKEKAVENPHQHIGRFVTITYKGLTEKGIPKFGTIKCFREDF